MRILVFTLLLCFPVFSAIDTYAAVNNISATYPAASGSYNRLVLSNLQAMPDCTATNTSGTYTNAGVLFMYTDPKTAVQNLEMCTSDGTKLVVPYPETCFNRYCSNGNGLTCPNNNFNYNMAPSSSNCPSGYTQASYTNTSGNIVALVDYFQTDGTTWVYSTVCCTTPTINNVQTNSTVLPTQ